MFKISKLADYGAVILSELAQAPGQRLSANQLADATQLPVPTVSKLLKQLNEALLVSSTRGAAGGYQLACDAKEITLAEIIRAIDGPLAFTECSSSSPHGCKLSGSCNLKHNWQYINEMIIKLLSQLSLFEMNRPLNKVLTFKSLDELEHDK